MKAAVINEFGTPDVFRLVDLQIPTLKPHHVLVKVYATSVNQIDCKIRSGAVISIAPDFPAILHSDVSGVVVNLHSSVTEFKKGDEVYGCIGGVRGCSGALAEYVVVDSRCIAKKPHSLSFVEAAALPLVSITAWEALFDKAKIQRHQNILIQGGIGGVGYVAVQLARWYGANVFATVLQNETIELVKAAGAKNVVNTTEVSLSDYVQEMTDGPGFEVVFDTVGGSNLEQSFEAATNNGIVVTTAARSKHDLSTLHNKALSLHAVFMLLPLPRAN